jgi:hypothetical protein
MGFGPPGRYDVPLVGIAIGKNHRDLDAIHNPDGVDPYLSVLEAIIRPLYGWPIEYPRSVLKRNAVSTNISEVLAWVPSKSHASYLQNLTGF